MTKDALLVLEDGTTFHGESLGAEGTAFGEVVFNTAMTGYQEILTDPSYHGQLVAMTAVEQGTYGLNDEDLESGAIQAGGFIVRSASRRWSNWRGRRSLHEALAAAGVVGLAEVDTRRLTRHIRSAGALRGAISTAVADREQLRAQVLASPSMEGSDLTAAVSTPSVYERGAPDAERHVVALDFGMKRMSLRLLEQAGCRVTVVPGQTDAEQALQLAPDGVFVSNGPGDPAAVRHGVAAVRRLLEAGMPTFGICLGHQLLGLAAGARTYKLPFGHHGANHPIRSLRRGTIEIATHNHGFALDRDSFAAADRFGGVEETHVNLNDGTNAGIRLREAPAFSVQYHPEAGPGPHDSRYLFDEFLALMDTTPEGR